MKARPGLAVAELDGPAGLGPRERRSLARGRGLYGTVEWLSACRAHARDGARCFVAIRDDGAAGVLPVYRYERGGNPRYDPGSVAPQRGGVPAAEVPGGDDVLLAGRAGYRTELLTVDAHGTPARITVLRALCERAVAHADGVDARTIACMYAPTEEIDDVCRALGRAVPVLAGGEVVLDVAADDFDGYLRRLSSRRRSAVRKEVRAFTTAGYDVDVVRLSRVADVLAPMLTQVQRKHGRALSRERVLAYLRRQADHLDRFSRVFVCRRAERPVAFSLFYLVGDTLFARVVGFDYAALYGAYEYFNMLVYEPLKWALGRNVRTLHLGTESYQAKMSRGGRMRPLWAVVGLRSGAGYDFAAWDVEVVRRRVRDFKAAHERYSREGTSGWREPQALVA